VRGEVIDLAPLAREISRRFMLVKGR